MRHLPTALLGFALTSPSLPGAHAAEQVLYDRSEQTSLADVRLFLEGPLAIAGRASLVNTPEGLTFTPGGNGFTLWKFADLTGANFDLRLVFQIPPGIRYSNSGIYFLFTDPTRAFPEQLPEPQRRAYADALAAARARADRYGAGPYEADFFARELQIIAGFENGLPPENHGPGAFYGVDPVTQAEVVAGRQVLHPYDLFIGDTYELLVEVRGPRFRTYLRAAASQPEPVLVSDFLNVSRAEDPIRGGSPIALLLQAFPNNGADVRGPIFQRITLEYVDP
jgi:hypothetical protein